jgi:two-component system OmpR family response regulator
MLPSRASKFTILVVDDIEDMRELVAVILTKSGYEVLAAQSGSEMDSMLAHNKVDLIILDTMMPVEDGLSICKRLSQTGAPPIIMLSARGQDTDRVKGLDLGAEDYIAKPFHPDELVARVRVVLRRFTKNAVKKDGEIAIFFGWRLDPITRKLTSPDGVSFVLSAAEFAILRVLLDFPDRPLKRHFILARMADLHEHSTSRALDTIVSRLRKKMAEAYSSAGNNDEIIRTVYGVGYMLKPMKG